MGHDISAYKHKDDTHDQEIAYLRRSAFNDLAREIYKALGAEEADAGCSGCGLTTWFSKSELEAALARLPKTDELMPELLFLCELHRERE
jgi:hypothetical protein